MRKNILCLLSIVIFEWHMLGGNPQHTNYSGVEFSSTQLKLIWTFDLGEHIWKYTRRSSVWSSSAVSARIGEEVFIFIGSYTHNLYCINAKDGKEVWRFTTGGPINSAPVFAWVKDQPIVIVASTDRVVYCLDARSGEKLWDYLLYPWTFTVFEAVSSSPCVVEVDGSQYLILGIWYADRRPFKTLQQGEVLCLDLFTGKRIWNQTISSSFLFSPAFVHFNTHSLIFITSIDGNVYCLSAQDGSLIWKFTSSIPITSSPLVVQLKDKYVVLFGTYFGLIFSLDAKNGEIFWKHKLKMQISSTGAAGRIGESYLLFVPSYDRSLYVLDLSSGKHIWSYSTKQHISSSPIILKIQGKEAVIIPSLDNKVYCLEAKTGTFLWSHPLGRRLWAYETRGETLWPSPIAISSNNKSLLIVPWYDGKIYAFGE